MLVVQLKSAGQAIEGVGLRFYPGSSSRIDRLEKPVSKHSAKEH